MGSINLESPTESQAYYVRAGSPVHIEVTGSASGAHVKTKKTEIEETVSHVDVQFGSIQTVRATFTSDQTTNTGHFVTWKAISEVIADGDLTITATAEISVSETNLEDPDDPGSTSTQHISTRVTVTVFNDRDRPGIFWTLPDDRKEYECPVPNDDPVALSLTGTASDDVLVDRVAVGLALDQLSNAEPKGSPPAVWSSWSATVVLPRQPGKHTIFVRAWDKVGREAGSDQEVWLVDSNPPEGLTLAIDAPQPFIYDGSPIPFTVSGAVRDRQSGIDAVEVSLSSGETSTTAELLDPHGPDQTTRWRGALTVNAAGSHSITARARDNSFPARNVATVSGTLVVNEIAKPVVQIVQLKTDSATIDVRKASTVTISGTDEGATVTVIGDSSATNTHVERVDIRLDNDTAKLATPRAEGDWSAWSAVVHIPPQGTHTITARATSTAHINREGVDSITVTVGVGYRPQDTEDNISLRAYFKDLLVFTRRRILISDGGVTRNLTEADLTGEFFQPFDRLEVNEQLLQVRVCVEVLRAYLAVMNKHLDGAVLREYCQTAYQALLVQFGTSYDELRLARSADRAGRRALATRLGIDLADTQTAQDRLNQILLPPDQITEARLEQIFGLVDTSHDPLAQVATPALFTWQMEHLRTRWRQQDHPASPGEAAVSPLIDPDIVGPGDLLEPIEKKPSELAEPPEKNLANRLWQERRAWVDEQRSGLASDRQSDDSDRTRLDRLVNATIAPGAMAELQALADKSRAGEDITPKLPSYSLSLPAFQAIMHLRDLTARGPLLDSEWNDLYDILTQVKKLRKYAQWRLEEMDLTLGPDSFKLADDAPTLPSWRASAEVRHAWQETLRARVAQQETVRQVYLDAVAAAESTALPLLRDALVAAISAATDIDVANWLTERLMIDVKSSGHLRTSRMTQAVETIQSILIALRTGRFMEMDRQIGQVPSTTWTLTVPDAEPSQVGAVFDQEWTWMGTYANWRAAMRVFLYPENLLLPTLRRAETVTKAFRELLEALSSKSPVTATAAQSLASDYVGVLMPEGSSNEKSLTDLARDAGLADWRRETFVLNEQIAEADLARRAVAIQQMMEKNGGRQPLHAYLAELFYFVPMQLALQLHKSGQYTAALDWFRTVYGYNLPVGQRKVYYDLKREEAIDSLYETTDQWLRTALNPHDIAPMRAGAFTRFTIISIVRCFLDYADSEFASDSGEAIARARTLYLAALDLIGSADMRLPKNGRDPAEAYGFVGNPEPLALRRHAELSLFKLRSGRNIAGMQRQSLSYASQNRDQVETFSASGLRPTPYRYSVLIERAKQLVTLAQQMEAAYLSALEKRDAETYNLLKAGQHLGLAHATVQLQMLRVAEATGGVVLATIQHSRAQVQRDTYRRWISVGPIGAEQAMLLHYRDANQYRNWAAGLGAAITASNALTTSSSGGYLGTGLGAGYGAASVVAGLAAGQAIAQINANIADLGAQEASFQASYERRRQEWQLQQSLAEKDVAIGRQQVAQAQDHLRVVTQERVIAQMQANHAQAEVDFLARKFTNAELYEWMSGVLGRVYSYFLQQATAIARLAQNQLAFERQERPLSLIRADYWQAPSEALAPAGSDGATVDRRGLTGSARLLQDIYQLDQYAFETNKRKLQLSKTLSLAQLAPIEFQHFRQTGVLPFLTPMELFDRDFPGHYLRLIKRVRTSVVALIPPHQGIRATLTASGISRVVIGDNQFQEMIVRRDPELVALTSPSNATGLFELEPQSDLLLPFEAMGVDTAWEFQMPLAANPFDYRTIADVLITIEYTALHSFEYRQKIIQMLNRTVSAERAFSLRNQFPDHWYELHNPDQSQTPMTIRFNTTRQDFPPNLVDLQMQQLALYFIGADDETRTVEVSHLHFKPLDAKDTDPPLGGGATSIDGVISTRRGNATNWASIIGKPLAGMWELKLAENVRSLFKEGKIEDILLVITYAGRAPEWPL